jgi:hypothetical protein
MSTHEALGRGIRVWYTEVERRGHDRGSHPVRTACCFFGAGEDPQPGEKVCAACHEKLVGFWDWLQDRKRPAR